MQQESLESEVVLRGEIKRITFRNPENGYSVMQMRIADREEHVTVVGSCIQLQLGSSVMVRGAYITHPRWGKQLNASSIVEVDPESAEGIERYLGSGMIKGVGPKTAKRLVQKFGAETLDVIYREPDQLAHAAGIGRHKANLIVAALKEQREIREVMRFLIEHNISTNLAARIYQRYQNQSVEVLKRDPYLLARDMRGVGFQTADTIAMNLGLNPDSPQRIKAGIYYALEEASDDGHCYLPHQLLAQRARALLGLGEELDLEAQLNALLAEQYVVSEGELCYLRHLYRAETFVAEFVAARCAETSQNAIKAEVQQAAIKSAEAELKIKFSAEQLRAVDYASRYPFMIITGGPGCGKTTVVRALSALFKEAHKKLLLAAPTGRAAQRMSQVTGMHASTIHRLLKYDPHRRGFLHGPKHPLACDALIVDEASMIDVQLARDLFSAVPANATLILVGDRDQLPSVGPGRVFGELLSLKEVHSVALSQLFRRSHESSINTYAHMINSGIVPEIPEPDGATKSDAYFLRRNTPEEAASLIEALVAEQLPKKFSLDRSDITVLTPSNRGPLGTIELNKRLQQRLNPIERHGAENELKLGDFVLRLGDRVCQRVNNYNLHEAGVFNGDVGQIYSIDRKERGLVVEMWDGRLVKYETTDISQLALAYALSVHRSQGSEMACVVLALHESHFALLERQLLYTAVTRAKKLLVVVGSKKALAIATKRMESKRRYTNLREKILTQLS